MLRRRPDALLLLVLCLLPLRAGADLCQRPDGSYTNKCTSADDPVKGGRVVFGSPSGTARESSAGERPAAADAPAPPPASEERYWRERLRQARRDLRDAESALVETRRELGSCRARQHAALGSALFDSCDESALEAAEHAVEQARDHVENGVFEECRRSETCLPGWIQ